MYTKVPYGSKLPYLNVWFSEEEGGKFRGTLWFKGKVKQVG
jgi:hypothetical protein